MTPAEELRTAAARLREKAEGTTDGPWSTVQDVEICPRWIISGGATEKDSAYAAEVARSYDEDQFSVSDADWEWMAFASPALSEPLAALLDATADEIHRLAGDLTEAELATYRSMVPTWPAALNVARAILYRRSGS